MPKVFTAPNPTEAHLVLGLLNAAGIAAEIRGEALFTTMKGAPAIIGALPEVWVSDPRLFEPAQALVESYRRGEVAAPADAQAWRCPDCGEEHEPQFTSCWKCGGGPA